MFCSRCGAILRKDTTACPECGQETESPLDAAFSAQVTIYEATVRKLGLWFVIFAALNAGLGMAGFINGILEHGAVAGPFEPWPHPPLLAWTYTGNVAWMLLTTRVLLALLAGAGLRMQAPWGRRMGVLAAALAVTQFPIGLLFGAYALVRLMGPRNLALYRAITGGVREVGRLEPR